ncbi:hypothetical protein [Cryobacterium tepidiphilum]|uniref:hypothetical protein n=1 Tax=Cryobacterium tepidiphilum TaxID=2486026 RepID=UPI001313E359|nr:hypothetical protein [Cryobacterium tepidiphilum]
MSLIVSVELTASVLILANLALDCSPIYVHIIGWSLSGISAASYAYGALSLVTVANLL